ncbi:hypothetical protein [Paraburkholderia mimosarum]|uniref:hypothetical protein n=1 Tax=Paraburkholderia mimosarum TaxID=312026 RepID=UPI000424DC6B|nr:hypothetical protein [Paraburkholderia mimosarum]
MTLTSRWAFTLAVVATGTALCLSVLAGWQRGGTLPERLVWVALGVVLVLSAHLLPALVRTASPAVRAVAAALWAACLVSACYGHATFFLLAQQHAGEVRAQADATIVPIAPSVSGRTLTVVMAQRVAMTRQLQFARLQRCPRDCSSLQVRRVMLAARLDALDAEAEDIRRRQAMDDRVTALRDTLGADPVTVRLAALLGTGVTRLDLLAGLMFAAVLEGVACVLWALALESRHAVTGTTIISPVVAVPAVPQVTSPVIESVTKPVKEPATASYELAPAAHVAVHDRHVRAVGDEPDAELARLAMEVAAGRVRPTVADIRRHLSCSQARAAALRRQLAECSATA